MGIVARWKGDRKGAMELYKQAGSSPEVSYNMGIIEIQNGNYAGAVSNFGAENTFNSALAKLLNGNSEGAMSTIDNSTTDKDAALSFYLKAVAGARQNKADVLTSNLKVAIQKDASFKQMAKDDAEFIKFRENADFKAMVN